MSKKLEGFNAETVKNLKIAGIVFMAKALVFLIDLSGTIYGEIFQLCLASDPATFNLFFDSYISISFLLGSIYNLTVLIGTLLVLLLFKSYRTTIRNMFKIKKVSKIPNGIVNTRMYPTNV